MASKFRREVVNQVKDTMLGPKDKLVLSEENWDYICQTLLTIMKEETSYKK